VAPVEEWGGITYALSALDAALADDWEIVPIMMVGEDLAARAREFLGTLRRLEPDASLMAVPYPAQRVELRYHSEERRTERLTGGMPAWSWLALKPLLDEAKLDALLINFLSGWELDLETTTLIRQHFAGPIHCDLHMMAWAVQPDGLRTLRPIPNIAEWCRCFDFLQMNEDELAMVAPDPLSLAATAIAAGVSCLFVTLGKRGGLSTRRLAQSRLRDDAQLTKLFDVLAARYASREGGYTRIIKAGIRASDAAPIAIIELVDRDVSAKGQDSGPAQNVDEYESEAA
jgi:hypothetical protein